MAETPSPTGFASLPPPVQSALIAMGAMILFSIVPPSVRLLSDTMSPYQIVGLRAAMGVTIAMTFFSWAGFYRMKTAAPWFHFGRASLNVVGMLMWFWALGYVELAKGIAIHFTMPLFITIFAVLFLGERIRLRRSIATLVGFAGVMIILRPGMTTIGLPELAILGSAALYGVATILVKVMVRADSPFTVTFYSNFFMGLWCLVPAILTWVPVTTDDILPLLGLGVCGLMAPLLLAMALKRADASLISAFDFLRLPFTAIFGYALFAEVPDIYVWIGAAIIFASTYYITMRETRAHKTR